MGSVLSKNGTTLFPAQLTNEMFNLVRGKSSLAKLSQSEPIPFVGKTMFTFNLDSEIDIVAENEAKTNGGATIGTKTIVPIKVEYGMRVSDEFKYAAEEVQLQYLRSFAEGFANKVARGLDIMALHGVNPRTKALATNTIGTNYFDSLVTNYVVGSTDANANISDAVALVQGAEHEVTGIAMSNTFKGTLAAQKKGTGSNEPLFPELAWGGTPEAINGIKVDSNSTVSFDNSTDLAIVGNFRDFFKWGYAKEIPIEIIEYGNPDNDAEAGDLKGHNQVYLRGELYLGWGIIVPDAFTRIVSTAPSA